MVLCMVLIKKILNSGYKQANLAILPQKFAADFEVFANGNKGAIPLLYKSKPGEFQAPLLCDDSDVRTDVPLYNKIVNGKVECCLDDLLSMLYHMFQSIGKHFILVNDFIYSN